MRCKKRMNINLLRNFYLLHSMQQLLKVLLTIRMRNIKYQVYTMLFLQIDAIKIYIILTQFLLLDLGIIDKHFHGLSYSAFIKVKHSSSNERCLHHYALSSAQFICNATNLFSITFAVNLYSSYFLKKPIQRTYRRELLLCPGISRKVVPYVLCIPWLSVYFYFAARRDGGAIEIRFS